MDEPGRPAPGTGEAWEALLDRLYARSRGGMVLGLERIERVLETFGSPHLACPMIHIAGSNGKGSTAAFAASILGAGSKASGLYTSPHLSCLTERVQIVREGEIETVSREEMRLALEAIEKVAPDFGDLTFFEIVTAAGLKILADRRVDAAVIEAGLGARLDATRLVRAEVSVLTDLALEHTAILGDSLEKIAKEKVAVLREGRPLVVAGAVPEVLELIEATAAQARSPVFLLGREIGFVRRSLGCYDFDLGDRRVEGVHLSLLGPHQARNAALAAKAACLLRPELTERDIRAGLESARWPGRMELLESREGVRVLFDGAHNPAAVEVLCAGIDAHRELLQGPIHTVFGVLSDKDAGPMIDRIASLSASLVLTRPRSSRAQSPAALLSQSPATGGIPSFVEDDPSAALTGALERAANTKGWVLVCGSLYLVGDLRDALNRLPPLSGQC